MSTLVFADPESYTQADGAQSSRVPVPLPEDPYEAIRQAYLVGTDTEGFWYIRCEIHVIGFTVSLSPDHPLTHTTPVLVPILRRTTRMAVRVPPMMSPGLFTSIAEVAAMSDLAFCRRFRSSYDSSPSSSLLVRKRYRGTSKLILGTDSEEDEEVDETSDSDSESEDAEDEGLTPEDEDPTAGDEGLVAGVEGPSMDDESYGLDDESYGLNDEQHGVDDESRSIDDEGRGLESDGLGSSEEDNVPEGQQRAVLIIGTTGSGSVPEPGRSERVSAFKQPILITWTDPEDASPMATSTATIPVDEDQFIEVGAQLELYRGILQDHTQRLDAMPQTLFKEIDRDVRELYTRSRATALQREMKEMRDRMTVLEQEKDRKER
nr:hypothetical protein [Tanacetum cinerariifolium]